MYKQFQSATEDILQLKYIDNFLIVALFRKWEIAGTISNHWSLCVYSTVKPVLSKQLWES